MVCLLSLGCLRCCSSSQLGSRATGSSKSTSHSISKVLRGPRPSARDLAFRMTSQWNRRARRLNGAKPLQLKNVLITGCRKPRKSNSNKLYYPASDHSKTEAKRFVPTHLEAPVAPSRYLPGSFQVSQPSCCPYAKLVLISSMSRSLNVEHLIAERILDVPTNISFTTFRQAVVQSPSLMFPKCPIGSPNSLLLRGQTTLVFADFTSSSDFAVFRDRLRQVLHGGYLAD